MGIRIALGATRSQAEGLVMRQAATMVMLGVLPGVVAAWAAGYALRSYLYGVRPLDLETLVTVGLVSLAIATCAASLPALRAAQVDPMEALRTE
jgi:putative ABC transport system permease protein